MTHQSRSEPRQVDLEEYIEEKTGVKSPGWAEVIRGRTKRGPEQKGGYMYQPLLDALNAAYDQAAHGKGKERHANEKSFMEQPIMEIGRMVGIGYQTGQAMKKAQEATRMIENGRHEAARAEFLGAIVYLAAAYLLVGEKMSEQQVDFGSNGV